MKEESDHIYIARKLYTSFAEGDRDTIEKYLTSNFHFSSPPDPNLDRAGFFERCWPHAGDGQAVNFIRLIEWGDEVIVTYEMSQEDGSKGRNTEVLTFDGDQVCRQEVYFGWSYR
jgi:hypothetical protein